jgi:ribosomal protein S18 acetylase RimI-like enzyme
VRIAEIHKSQFSMPGTLLGRLSPALIAGFYAGFLDRSIFLVHATNGVVDGFVLGGSYRELMRCKLSMLRDHPFLCILEVARRPQLWLRLVRPISKLLGSSLTPAIGDSSREEFRLLSIAVAPEAMQRGIGTALVHGFDEAICELSDTYDLGVLKNNAPALQFYEKLAFECVGETAISWTLRRVLRPNIIVMPASRAA